MQGIQQAAARQKEPSWQVRAICAAQYASGDVNPRGPPPPPPASSASHVATDVGVVAAEYPPEEDMRKLSRGWGSGAAPAPGHPWPSSTTCSKRDRIVSLLLRHPPRQFVPMPGRCAPPPGIRWWHSPDQKYCAASTFASSSAAWAPRFDDAVRSSPARADRGAKFRDARENPRIVRGHVFQQQRSSARSRACRAEHDRKLRKQVVVTSFESQQRRRPD